VKVPSLAALGRKLDVSSSTVKRWKRRGMPQEPNGSWDVDRCRAFGWEIDGRRGKSPGLVEREYLGTEKPGKKRRAHEANPPPSETRSRSEPTIIQPPPEPSPSEQATAAFRKAKAALAIMELAEKKKELIKRKDVVEADARRILEIKQTMFAMCPKLALRLAPMEDEREIHDALVKAFQSLCKTMASRSIVDPNGHTVA